MMHLLFAIGTRPEFLKLVPLILEIKKTNSFKVTLCFTGQHKSLMNSVTKLFEVSPDINLDVLVDNQSLASLSCRIIERMDKVLEDIKPDAVIVHGDTTTAFASALVAFYHRIKVAHVESGLRTHDLYSPWPEEGNRQMIARLSDVHLCPTELSKETLLLENPSSKNVLVTGNTVIDTLHLISNKLNPELKRKHFLKEFGIDTLKPYLLVTAHRRENYGDGFKRIFDTIKLIRNKHDLEIVFPVHLNPNVKNLAYETLNSEDGIHLIEPQGYEDFIFLMRECRLILTDSGGIQEEALSFNKPVLVMRETTERPEGLATGFVHLVGSDPKKIESRLNMMLNCQPEICDNPYGDGKASARIVKYLQEIWS